ncbi:MAG: hypothetical protein WCK57_14160 [Verrucomicrobiae bacterium]
MGACSVLEVTREVTFLAGKNKGTNTREQVLYVSTHKPDAAKADKLLAKIRDYWGIEGGLHQRLDVTAREDESRVRNRNSLLVLGMLRRTCMSIYDDWRRRRKNKRQSTLKDFHDKMSAFNQQLAFNLLTPSPR